MIDLQQGGKECRPSTRGSDMKRMIGLGGLAGLMLAGGAANATTTITSTFGVSLAITAQCVINSTATLDFGSNGVINGNIDTNSPLVVQCTNTTPYAVALDKGTSSGGTIAQRKLINGGATVNYNLYTDSPGGTLWGDGTTGVTLAGTGNGAAQTITIYGRIPAQTTAAPGTYTDTITVSVTY
jgi:spore coat protein U domain-containing protein, fimbrial subunit CupE1/2/3/6